MGHHQQNLTLTSSLKMINVHYVALLLDLALCSSNFSLFCSRLTVNFLSLGQPYCEGKSTLKLFTSDQLPRPSISA